MEAYIKSFATFRAQIQREALHYDLTIDSLASDRSLVMLAGVDFPASITGQWLVLNSVPMWIDTITPGKGRTTFECYAADAVFNRQLVYTDASDTTIGGFLTRVITANWINQTDGAYATPYITIINNDDTPFVAPEPDDNGLYNLLEYIRMVRRVYNVSLQFAVDHNALVVTIAKEASVMHPLVLDDGHTQLASSSFASSMVSKITVIQPVKIEPAEGEEPEEDEFEITQTDWYLSQDGTASTAIPANRADGEWITIVVSEQEDQAEAVQAEFAKNGETHKVELYTDTQMAVNDKFRVRLNGELFEGTVIKKSRRKGDNRALYTSGDLITTIQERVHRAAAAQQTGYTGDGSGQMYAVGDIYLTTRQGNPASLLGYGAWEQIQGRFLFAADSAHAVNSKGGEASHTITAAELPEMSLPVKYNTSGLVMTAAAAAGSARTVPQLTTGSSDLKADLGGQGNPISLMPPYFTVYAWIRRE